MSLNNLYPEQVVLFSEEGSMFDAFREAGLLKIVDQEEHSRIYFHMKDQGDVFKNDCSRWDWFWKPAVWPIYGVEVEGGIFAVLAYPKKDMRNGRPI